MRKNFLKTVSLVLLMAVGLTPLAHSRTAFKKASERKKKAEWVSAPKKQKPVKYYA